MCNIGTVPGTYGKHRTARNEGSKVWGHMLCGNLSATLRRTRPSCASCGFCVECGRRHRYVNLQTAQALRWNNCPGQHVARQALRARFLLSHPSKVAMTRNSILRQENASLNLIAHGPRCPVTSYPLLGIAHKCSPPSASVSCASSDSCS